jgi:hypothetical protein
MANNIDMLYTNIDIPYTIWQIKPDAHFWCAGSNNEEQIAGLDWQDGNPTNITTEQILAKQAELKTAYDAKQYQRDRTKRPEDGGYPSIGDQLDDIYHNGIDGWKATIKAVKDANPK